MTHTPDHRPGPLLLIGGAEDKVGARTILHRFVTLSGGLRAHIGIVATASGYHDMVGQMYVRLFNALGVAHVDLIELTTRTQARQQEPVAQLDQCTGIFLTGGDQLKLTALLGGTPVAERMRQLHRSGVTVAGTSAGASAASEHMVAYGRSGITPRRSMMQFAPGLGLVRGIVVDQHFGARGRTGRLIAAVAHNPSLLGIGIDEDTATEITPDGLIRILGSGSVMIIDATDVISDDIHHVPKDAPFSILGLKIHILTTGARFDLASRTPYGPEPRHTEPDLQGIAGEGI